MHSSRMRTDRSSSRLLGVGGEEVSASVHAGIHTPPGLGLETPPARPPNLPHMYGPGETSFADGNNTIYGPVRSECSSCRCKRVEARALRASLMRGSSSSNIYHTMCYIIRCYYLLCQSSGLISVNR